MTTAARRLPRPGPEPAPIRDLSQLAPGFRRKWDRVAFNMAGRGMPVRVVETLRTDERQQWLYAMGRTHDDGRGVVTFSETAADTWHAFGLALDAVCAVRRWDARPEFWRALGEECRAEGLTWGGDWNGNGRSDDERFYDAPHVQFGPGMRRSPSVRASQLVSAGGLPAVWAAVGAA